MVNRIREIRKQKKMPVSVLAEKLNITPKHFYDLEMEKRRLHDDLIRQLSEIFDVTTDYLLGYDRPTTNKNISDDELTHINKIKKLTIQERELLEAFIEYMLTKK